MIYYGKRQEGALNCPAHAGSDRHSFAASRFLLRAVLPSAAEPHGQSQLERRRARVEPARRGRWPLHLLKP
jgi:hypothetical protein